MPERPPFLEGEQAQRWRQASEVVHVARRAGRPGSVDEVLLRAASEAAGTVLEPLFLLWAADDWTMAGRADRAVEGYRTALETGEGAVFADVVDLGDAIREQLAAAEESRGHWEDAARVWLDLAETTSDPGKASYALYRAGRLAEQTEDPKTAGSLYRRAADVPVDETRAHNGFPVAELAREALRSVDAGPADAEADPDSVIDRLGRALRAGEIESLTHLLSPSHVSIGAVGGDRAFPDRDSLLHRLREDLAASDVVLEPGAAGTGGKRYVMTAGWQGEWFRGRVAFLVSRQVHGWRWTGVLISELTPAWIEEWTPRTPEANQPLPFSIKSPWPEPKCFTAGGLRPYLFKQAAILAAAAIPFVGPFKAAILTMGFAASRCGFGPGGFYYNFGPTHQGSDAFAIDFTRYVRGVPYWDAAGGTDVLAVRSGLVTVARGHISTGDPSLDNRVVLRHTVSVGWISPRTTRYESRSLHLSGPGQLDVSVGMYASQGWRLGPMDDTGNSALNHLHFSIHDMDAGGDSVRPTPMDGHRLEDRDEGRCMCSQNEAYQGWQVGEVFSV